MVGVFGRRTVVVSSGPSVAFNPRASSKTALPAAERVARKRRRVCVVSIETFLVLSRSRLKLAFELVQKAPIGALGDDLLRRRFDEACVALAQSIEPDRVFGVILAP